MEGFGRNCVHSFHFLAWDVPSLRCVVCLHNKLQKLEDALWETGETWETGDSGETGETGETGDTANANANANANAHIEVAPT